MWVQVSEQYCSVIMKQINYSEDGELPYTRNIPREYFSGAGCYLVCSTKNVNYNIIDRFTPQQCNI